MKQNYGEIKSRKISITRNFGTKVKRCINKIVLFYTKTICTQYSRLRDFGALIIYQYPSPN